MCPLANSVIRNKLSVGSSDSEEEDWPSALMREAKKLKLPTLHTHGCLSGYLNTNDVVHWFPGHCYYNLVVEVLRD